MLIAVKSKRFSVTGYKRMFVILIKKTLGSGFKYSAFDYCGFGWHRQKHGGKLLDILFTPIFGQNG